MAGIYEQLLDRSRPTWQPPSNDAAFPDVPVEQPVEEAAGPDWLMKRMKKAALDKKNEPLAAVDASAPAIQRPLIMQPGLGAGMIDGAFPGSDQSPFLNPTQRAMQASVGGDPGPAVPMPRPAPPGAKQLIAEGPPAPAPPPIDLTPQPKVMAQGDDGEEDAQPVAKSGSPAQSASPFNLPSILDRLRTTLGNNSNTLLALGAGFAGAPNVGQGISRASAAAIPARAADIKQTLDQGSQSASYQALIKAGAPPELARAAMGNPVIMKSAVENYLGDRKKEMKVIEHPNGAKETVLFDPFSNKTFNLDGTPYDAKANSTVGGIIDPSLTGDQAEEAAKAANPALHKQAMAYVEGRELWPNPRAMKDPRIKQATDLARQIDPTLTERTAIDRNVYGKDVASTSFSKAGGQVKAFHQGIDHFLSAARAIEKYNPSGGFGFEPVAHAINSARELTTHQTDLANHINSEVQTGAGEVGKLFSNGGTGHERAETAGRFKSINSGPAAAGALEGTIETMEGGLRALEANRDRVMGEKGSKAQQYQFRTKETEAKIAEIRQIIGRLRGEKAAVAQQPAAAAPPPPGKYIFQNGALVPAQ